MELRNLPDVWLSECGILGFFVRILTKIPFEGAIRQDKRSM